MSDGGLVVAGFCDGMGLLRKYDAELVQAWENHGDLPAGLVSVDVLEPIDGDVIVGGKASDLLRLARVEPDGSAAWTVVQSIPELEHGMLRDAAVMPEGDVIAVGPRYTIEDPVWVGRFEGTSGLRWSRLLVSDSALPIVGAVVDAQGRIFVTSDAEVFELDGEGELVGCWQHTGTGGYSFPEAYAVAASAELGLVVAGSLFGDTDRTAWVARLVP